MTSLDEYDYPILYGNKKNLKFEFKELLSLATRLPEPWQIFWTALVLKIAANLGVSTGATEESRYKTHKILMVCPHGYTGLAYYIFSLCQSLSEAGYDVELFTSDKWILETYKSNFSIKHSYIGASGDKAKYRKGINYIFSLLRTLKLLLLDKGKRIHVQIVEVPIVDIFMFIILKMFGKIIIFTPHDIHHRKNYPLNKTVMRLIYKLSNTIIVHKNINKDQLELKYGVKENKIFVIPHGGYEYFANKGLTKLEAREKIGLIERDFMLLFFGDIRPDKDIETLVRAIPAIARNIPNTKLVVAGRPSHGLSKEWINELIERAQINKLTLLFLSFIEEKDVTSFYLAADLVVLPYKEISESGVLRYAQTLGIPVICSDLPEFSESIIPAENGLLFKVGDPDDLSRQVISAWQSEKLPVIGNTSREQFLSKCSWSLIAEKTGIVYETFSKHI